VARKTAHSHIGERIEPHDSDEFHLIPGSAAQEIDAAITGNLLLGDGLFLRQTLVGGGIPRHRPVMPDSEDRRESYFLFGTEKSRNDHAFDRSDRLLGIVRQNPVLWLLTAVPVP